jgi:hypothetical protein
MFGKLSEEELLKPIMKNLYTWDWMILGQNEAEKQIHFELSAGSHVKTAMSCHHAWL